MSRAERFNIAVIYAATSHPMRRAVHDHLYSFSGHPAVRAFYHNVAVARWPKYFREIPFDAVVCHTTFLGRWHAPVFWQLVRKVDHLRDLDVPKLALPQDEFINCDALVEFIRQFGVSHVFSVTPSSEWRKIYGGVDASQTSIHPVLTGYLDDQTVAAIDTLAKSVDRRDIDIGYRAFNLPPWLGRFGRMKDAVGRVFAREAPKFGLSTDVSTRPEDTFFGCDWYRFLLRCKYTIGVAGGSSINDHDGSIKQRTEAYLRKHPGAEFEEVEAACFPGQDGSLHQAAISPRHLEACATRTCQVLVEGEYSGVLKPGAHYIELKEDFSNLEQVLNDLVYDRSRAAVVEAAYQDIVASKKYTYRTFVDQILAQVVGDLRPRDNTAGEKYFERAWMDDRRCWQRVKRLSSVLRRLPTNVRGVGRVVDSLRRIYLMIR